MQGGTIWLAEVAPNLPDTEYRHVIRLCGEGEQIANKFHFIRDRLKGGTKLHDRWGVIDTCRETVRREGEVHTLDLEIYAPDTPMRDFQLGKLMDFLARYIRADVRHDPLPPAMLVAVAVPPPPSSSTDLVPVRTCPQGHNYLVQQLLYSGTCNECGG